VRKILELLGVGRSAYYTWQKAMKDSGPRQRAVEKLNCFSVLPEEREKVIRYALEHPSLRHRELAWKMVDDDVVCVSGSTVYRVLKEEGLVASKPQRKRVYHRASGWGCAPDQTWQTDLRYVKLKGRSYYLIMFLDEYSRYVVHWELMSSMDGNSVALAAEEALSKLDHGRKPVVQTDNGSGYVSREFKMVLAERGIGHHRIRPHTPEDNSLVERIHRTVGEALDEYEPENYGQALDCITEIVRYYNNERLHSGISYLRPIDRYRGDPERLLAQRCWKIEQARHRRKEENLRRKQKTLFLTSPQREEPQLKPTLEKSIFA
jgi:transposase InsO family protein